MEIRTATIDDLNLIFETEKICFTPEEAADLETFRERLNVFPNHFWMLFEDDRLVSFTDGMTTDMEDLEDEMYENINLHSEDGAWQMIFGLVTLPEARGKGYASTLIKHVIEESKKQGRKGIVLTCRERLINFYENLGFVCEGITSKSIHGGIVWYQMRHNFH